MSSSGVGTLFALFLFCFDVSLAKKFFIASIFSVPSFFVVDVLFHRVRGVHIHHTNILFREDYRRVILVFLNFFLRLKYSFRHEYGSKNESCLLIFSEKITSLSNV